ncbi:dynein heavy chain domain-containing protein 1-like [Lingula anatina]|uniref:Dynein heavy chain domain-containing protein 1-like n=1 Tax=Lingula anatina TaxID=7574 RepID=A0A1S3K8D0_LINAN|nr:dynein heavy chain domain-containing protein 1-like [Lingula anatina]|eukprot:XP_013418883.1 dynein heavy chain domain-containing protein 1-like [Lingula anatina]
MSTKVETSVDPNGNATSSAKLPVINGGRSLVSPTQAIKMPIKEQARQWLKDVRERVEASEDPNPDDLVTLRKELIALFITALQQDSRSSWDFLTEVVQQLTPCASHLSGSPELIHYLERAVQHMDTHKERLFDIHTVDALNKVFPEDMMRIQKPVRTYCGPISPSPTTSPRESPTRTGPTKSPRMLLPNGKDPYTLERPGDEKKYLPKPLTFGDLSKSLPTVAADLASREAIWQHSAGFTSQAMNVELLSEEELKGSGVSSRGSSRPPSEVADLQKLGEEIKITVETEKGQPPPPMTGREAVEYFGKLYHVGKIKHMYFNIAPHRHFRPYDLVAVPQNKANPEHYVFSTFGVLHVYPDQPSENMTLGEWHREAVLYAAVRSIPFFKYFLVRKALRCWHATKKQTDFAEVRDVIKNTLLPNVPCFGAALLQIAKLLHELLTVQFLPDEQDKRYLLPEFENIVNYKNIQAERFLERFFRYGKLIVDTVKEDCFKRLRYCEEQVKHKTVFTKDSLHLQKQKKEQREANLRKAKEETGCLGNFVRLVDQVMLAYLVDLAKRNVSVFVYNVMGAGRDAPREGLFLAHLGFNNKDVLGISPSKEKFLRGMTRVLQEIPGILVMKALPMDENPTITDGESMMDDSATARTRMSQVTATSEKRLRTQDGRTPELNRGKTPTKEEDNLGVATPDLVIKADFPSAEGLVVEGEGFMGQYHPLSKGNLEEKLKNDEEYNRAIKTHTDFLIAGLTEIDDYCKENSWLNEIHQFCKGWNDTSLQEWKGAPAFNIEQRLTEIRSWTERIKMSDRAFTTENGIFHVDCSALQKDLVPKLNSIYKELVTFVAEEASNRGKQFCNEMKVVLQNMRDKKVSMDAFAVYAKQITQYKKNSQQFQQRVEYIKSLFEMQEIKMVRMNYRQLNPEEEKIEENVWAAWEAFLFNMQEATEFVNMQTPLMTQNLEETFQASKHTLLETEGLLRQLEKEAYHLVEVGTTGKFLSPEENPSAMLSEMRQLRGKFYTVEHKLKECCKWKEMITGNPYNLDFLHKLAIKMDIRQELWKYVELSNHSIIDWKQQLFRKMNVQKAFDKVQEWQGIAFQMKSHLPLGDKVLANWFKVLQDFKQDLPLLHKLASDALKPRHWKEIFVGIGEEYEPGWNVTVAELLDLNLGEHSLLINTIYTGAKSEFALEQKLVKLRKLWQEKNLKLAKHIPDSVYDKDTAGVAPSAHPGGRKVKGMAKFRHEKALANMPKGLNISGDDMFVLIDVEELKYLIDDSQVTLTSMLVSPYLADLRPETEYWSSSLQQAEEILDLWVTCQKKWLYLLKVFEDPDIYRKLGSQSLKFESINAKYKEFIKSVVNDPKVTSIFSKQRGEPGYRRLQGEAIRELLQSLLEGMEQIQKHLENLLEHARSEFPRLYFLSNQEVVDLMGISRNPPALLPCAKKCFAGIKSLTFALPSQMTTMSTALDFVLNAHKLQVTSLTGDMEEAVPLLYKLEANNLATRWLSGLEEGMKSTMATMLQACVQARWEEGSKQSVLLLEELSRYEVSTAHPTQEQTQLSQQIRHSFKHWLLRFPSQCVLVAEAIMWQKAMTKALEHGDKDQLTEIRNQQNSKITQYVNFLRESSVKGGGSSVRKRLQRLLGCLVQQTTQHRDYVEVLLKLGSPTLDSYDWQKIMKFHMDFRSVLRAKTDIKEQPKPEVSSSTPRERRLSHGSSRDSLLSKSDASPKERRASLARLKEKKSEDSMARVKTSVSTGFQFTPCTIQQLGATFLYDHEYLGPSERLVFTPLTERAYLTLTLALRTFHCGTLVGPAATGKSETIKDLAKTLGRHCVTVNCNSELTLPLLNQYLSGMVQSGSWTVFDDTDRLTKGLMSVFAQQIEYLKTALHCLGTSSHNQYGIRGQPRYDKFGVKIFYDKNSRGTRRKYRLYLQKTFVNKEEGSSSVTHGGRVVRRNSLTTLHSLPSADTKEDLERQNTVPHGYNEVAYVFRVPVGLMDEGLSTYFGEAWVPRRERRHSIEKEIEIKESELYKSNKPPSLFVEHATYRPYKPKPDYKVLLHEPVHRPVFLGNVLFNGKLLKANANYGCFMTVNSEGKGFAEIPDNLRLQMRPCALIHPDTHQILEMMLYCNGCSDHKILAKKLGVLFELLKTQLPRKEQYNFSLRTMKTVVTVAHSRLSSNRNLFEDVSANDSETSPSILEDSSTRQEFAIVYAINTTLIPKMADQDDIALLKSLTRDVFPQSVRPKSGVLGYDPDLVSAVQEQMALDNLQATQAHVNKILQLNTAMNHGKGVILIGPAGSGKTTAYQTLARAMNSLHSRPPEPDKDDNKDEIKDKGIAFHSQQKLKFTELKTAREKKHWVTPKLLTENTEKRESNALSRFRKVSKSTSSVAEKLSTLLKDVNKAKRIQYPKIEINTFNPNAFSTEELFGSFQSGLWKDGLLSSILRDCHTQHESARSFSSTFDEKKHKGLVSTPSPVNKWVVLDGCVNPLWTEHMNTMLDSDRLLSLASGEKVALQDTTHLIFEMSHLANASPATISRCELVHCSNETVTWKSIVESWSKAAKQKWIISTNGLKILDDLFSSTIPQTIRYLENDCTYSLTNDMHRSSAIYTQSVPGLQEVMSLLRILSALCDRHFLRADFESAAEGQQKPDDAPPASPAKLTPDYRADSNMRSSRLTGSSRYEDRIPNYTNVVKSMYAFAFIWGFGGQLQERHISKFNKFCRETLYRATYPISLPLSGTVFDYCVEVHHGMMIKWSDRPMEKMRNLPAHYVITPEVERYHYLVDLLLSSHYPVLLVGVPGVGKTALIQNIIQQKHPFSRLPISQGVVPQQLHNSVANYMLEINKRDVLSTHPSTAPLPKPHHLFFIDDLNMAKSDCVTGTQPSLEVLREVMTQRSLYDRHRHVKLDLEGTDFVAACRSPGVAGSGAGESCHILSSRLTRLFTVMTFFMPTAEGMHSLFGKTIQSWLEEFPTYSVEHHHEFAYAMTQGLLEMYNVVKERLRPTPANAHYIFTLRDIARVMEGILMMSPRARPKLKPKPRRKKDKPELGRNKMTISLPALNKPVDRSKLRSQNWAPTAGKDVVGGAPPMMRVIARLWCHEVARTFGDRITAEEDCMWFKRTMEDIVAKYFCTGKAEFREKMSSIKEESGSQGSTVESFLSKFTRSSPVRRITPPPFYKSDSLTPDNELPSTASTVTITEVTTEVTTPFSDYATTMEFVTPLSQGEFTEAATTDVVTPFSTEYDIQSQYQSEFNAPIRAPPPSEDPGSRMSTGSTETETTEESSTEETASSEEDSETETTTSGMQSKMTTTGDESTAMTDYTRTPSGSTGLQLGHLESRTTLYSSIGLLSDSLEDSAANPSQASNLKAPPTPSLKKGGAKKEVKRGVTFKTGLIADRETEAYEGPLLSMEQIKLPNEDLTDIMFTKFIMASYTEAMGLTPDKGYVECSEDILDEALQTCLALYNAGTSQRLDLVFFKEAIQHMARLSRVLAMTNGHSLQLGMSYCTGRATVTRLAAHIAHCKLFEPKPQGDLARNREVLREHMRRCSQTAAIVGKPVVLMIHEELGEECLLDVCSYMVEGTCPGLYTTEELQQIATQMTPGQVQIRKVDKVEQTFNDKFIRRVKQNLHVVIILNYSGSTVYTKHSPMHNLLRKCPSLIHHVISVDLYKPWNHEAYVKVAETWLRDESSRVS